MSAGDVTASERAVRHVLRAIRNDGRLAYLLGYGSESFALLTAAFAETNGEDVEEFRDAFWKNCRPVRITEAA